MEIKYYFSIVKRWLWLLILGLILGGGAGYYLSSRETPVYQTSTRVLVMAAYQQNTFDTTYLYEYQLAQTYMQILTTTPVLEETSNRLGYTVSAGQISSRQTENTQIIEITVTDNAPEHAREIANTLVSVLLEISEEMQTGRYALSEESLQAQIAQVESEMNHLQKQIEEASSQTVQDQLKNVETQMLPLQEEVLLIQQELASLTPAYRTEEKTRIAELGVRLEQITPLLDLYQQIYSNLVVLGFPGEIAGNNVMLTQTQTTLNLYQQIYVSLLSSLESVQLARLQNSLRIVQIEAAPLPGGPIRPQPMQDAVLAAVVGLALAGGIVFLVEYLDDTLKTPDDILHHLDLPVIGYIAEMKVANKSAEALYVARQPRSPVTEAFRALRTNLEFAGVDQPLRTLLLTSPGPGEGKTTTAINLTAIIAQGERDVVLIDADLRRPRVHRFLSLSNQMGMSDLFRGSLQLKDVLRSYEGDERIRAITSGSLPPNPAELLGSARMDAILTEVSAVADMIIIDTPPSLVSDATILASKVDGVLVVIQPGKTNAAAAIATLEQLERSGARVLGVVLNRIPRNRADYYGGYQHYYSPYYGGYSYYSDHKDD